MIEFSGGNSYSKYLEVHSNQVRHQAKYLVIQIQSNKYYGLKLKVLSNRTTLVLSNTRELDRVSS